MAIALSITMVAERPLLADDVVPATASKIATFVAMGTHGVDSSVQLCQGLGPAAPCNVHGVDCSMNGCCELGWDAMGPIPWQEYAQGEYVGHERTRHVEEYRLRTDDLIAFYYRLTRDESSQPYELNVGDVIRVESFVNSEIDRDLIVQPDGTITLRLLGQVRAARLTIDGLRKHLAERYKEFYKEDELMLTVTPLKVNTRLEDLRATVDARYGEGGQRIQVRVTPEGTIQLPAIGSVFVQGLTLSETKLELDESYIGLAKIEGIEVTPVLISRAPRYVYVLGEVAVPGRFTLEGPTTVMQSIALAGSWRVGANLNQVVVFRRGDDWRLLATMLDIRGALYGNTPCPADEIWLNDSDIVVVPKRKILIVNEFIELVFTKGIYGIIPLQGITLNFAKASTL